MSNVALKFILRPCIMNAEGSARAANQVSDIAVDVSGMSAKHCVIRCDAGGGGGGGGGGGADVYKVTISAGRCRLTPG